MKAVINSYIGQFKALHNGEPWLDETFEKKLGGLSESIAFAQPAGLLSVAAEVWHLIAWRENVMERLEGKIISSDQVVNWRPLDHLKEMGWDYLWSTFNASHLALLKWLETKDDAFLSHQYPPTGFTYQYYLEGLIHHDAYHMGQIGLVLKLLRKIDEA